MNIDEMEAGAELDLSACEALGIEGVPVKGWRCATAFARAVAKTKEE